MKKTKRIILLVLAVLLIAAGFWGYWKWDMPMKALLPEENWHYVSLVGIELRNGYAEHVPYTVDEKATREIIMALETTEVNRSTGDSNHIFWLVLCPEGHGSMVSVSVCQNGKIYINDGRGERCYEGGGEFYEYLLQLTQTLPVGN